MKFEELKIILRRLYIEYVKKHLKRILIALILSIIVAGSTSGIAWLLDPAVKKIFIDQDETFAWAIPLLIIIAFSSKGLSLYFARINIIRVGQEVAGALQKKVAQNILTSDIQTLDNRHSGKYISNIMFDTHHVQTFSKFWCIKFNERYFFCNSFSCTYVLSKLEVSFICNFNDATSRWFGKIIRKTNWKSHNKSG